MMNRFIYLFLLLGCTALASVGCTGDPDVEPLSPGSAGEGKSWVTIGFGDNSFDEVHITTRATLDNVAESRVGNFFIFIFGPKTVDENGKEVEPRLYGRFFDPANRVDSEGELLESKEECWYVEGNATETEPEGKVRMYAPHVDGGSLYVLANVHADMVNISPEKLRFVQSRADLLKLTASLNQQITERNGFFPMTGWAEGVKITSSSIIFDNNNTADTYNGSKILLTRLDAKVEVQLRVAKDYEAYNSDTGTNHIIDSFVPLSWQVVNLPRTAFVLPNATDARDGEGKKDLFNTPEVKFETRESEQPVSYKNSNGETVTTTTDLHGFSFYMLENRPNTTGKSKISELTKNPNLAINPNDNRSDDAWRYHLRDTRRKKDGVYLPDSDGTGDIWEYAPAEGTYLVIKGEVVMKLKIDDEGKDQQLSADAVYYIHLGDFGSNVDDYDIERNTSYTYTITIYGVDSIEVEVEKGTEERESGATGHVYVAKEKIFTFDSHFGCEVVSFDQEHLTGLDHMTWYVRTPFGREGKPHIVNGVEVPAGLDYQWVKFMRNSFTTDENGNELYKVEKEMYDPAAVKDVLKFSTYIKEQKQKFDAWKKALAEGKAAVNESDFRLHFDEDWLNWYNETNDPDISVADARENRDGVWYRYRIYLTIFVDEFYYDANPLTGDVRQDLWKDFVNQPDRLMHILCDANKSKDEASLSTGSVVTIRQHSIQTIFNTQKPELKTAWGCEVVDETRDKGLWYFSRNESFHNPDPNFPDQLYIPENALVGANQVGNTSPGNGLYNTAMIWGLVNGGTYTPKLWSKYVDPNNEKSGLLSSDEIETMRYSCMTRNRDENGDDIIDAKEVKWYLAAISQLGSLYVGDQGLSADAVLYPYYKQAIKDNTQASSDDDVGDKKYGPYLWRAHIISSTLYYDGSGMPEVLWAEEGLSTGRYNDTWGKYAELTVRCVRNLGMDPTSEEDAQRKIMDENNISAVAIDVTGPGLGDRKGETVTENSVYTFDMTNLNPLSIRYYTSQELEPNNEFSVEAKTYWAFETGPLTDTQYKYEELYNIIRDGRSPCPEGYRTPNVREGALMSLRISFGGDYNPWQPTGVYSRVSTYYSHGEKTMGDRELGTGQDKGSYSWFFDTQRVRLDEGEKARIRCVRDIRQ